MKGLVTPLIITHEPRSTPSQPSHGGLEVRRRRSETQSRHRQPLETQFFGLEAMGFMWEFPKIRGTLFWGLYNKDPTI